MSAPTSQDVFQALVRAVGIVLPGGWELLPYGEDNWACSLVDADTQAKLFFRPSEWKNARRIVIRGELPKDSRGQTPHLTSLSLGQTLPTITVSGEKSPSKIASDIERRLLPEYHPLLAEAQNRIAQTEGYYSKVSSETSRFAKLLGLKVAPDKNKLSFYSSPYRPFQENLGSLEIHDDDVLLEMRLDHDTAFEILQLLKSKG